MERGTADKVVGTVKIVILYYLFKAVGDTATISEV
jgi:hypothetical protein